jgi:hypothetical protein
MPDASVVQTSADDPIYLEAFDRQKLRIRAVPNDTLETVNIEPLQAIQATQKALIRVKPMRERLIKEFTSFDVSNLDNLLDYSHAFAHATTLLRAAEPQITGFEALVEECSDELGKLEAYLRAANQAGVISTSRLGELKGGPGHRNIVHDLLLVAQIYRANWAKIEGKTFLTLGNIRHADAIAARLNSALAERESKPIGFDEVSLDRQKAYTLYYRAYMRVRSAVRHLLEQDGQEDLLEGIMPSLHANRGPRRRGKESETEEPVSPVTGVVSVLPQSDALPLTGTGGKVGAPDSDPFTS